MERTLHLRTLSHGKAKRRRSLTRKPLHPLISWKTNSPFGYSSLASGEPAAGLPLSSPGSEAGGVMKGMGGVGAGKERRHVAGAEVRRREKKLWHYACFSFAGLPRCCGFAGSFRKFLRMGMTWPLPLHRQFCLLHVPTTSGVSLVSLLLSFFPKQLHYFIIT